MALHVRISRISLQFLPSFRTEISSLSRDTCVDAHWGWVILQDLTWKNSIRPIFALVDLESQADEIEEMAKDGCAFVCLDTPQNSPYKLATGDDLKFMDI